MNPDCQLVIHSDLMLLSVGGDGPPGLAGCCKRDLAVGVWSSGQAGELLLSFSYYAWVSDTVDRFCMVWWGFGKVEGVKNQFYSENKFGVVFELGGLQRITVEVIDLEGDVGGLQVKDVRKGLNRSQL